MLNQIFSIKILLTLLVSLAFGACLAQQPAAEATAGLNKAISEAHYPYVSVPERNVILTDVTLHIGDGTAARRHQSIVIENGLIKAVGPHDQIDVSQNYRVINLSGHSVMPGIIGLHNHLHMPGVTLMEYTAPRLYLAGGVTTLQTAGSADPEGEIRLARSIAAGHAPGPDIFLSAPYITGNDGNGPMTKPATELAARSFVNQWANKGMTWIKLYRHTDPDIAFVIIDEAHKRGLKVTGHLCSITFKEASLMGIDSIEHGINAATDLVANKAKGECIPSRQSKIEFDPDGPEIATLIETLVDNNVTLTSTLAILETGFVHRPQAQPRALKAMSPDMRRSYQERQIQLQERTRSTTSTEKYWALITQFERRFVAHGGHLVAGSDTGRHILPGFGDQRNFELLVASGFSVPETIKIMTLNGAITLGIDDSKGLIKRGYQADMIVIPGDLASSPLAIRLPKIVFKSGIGFDPALLIKDVEGQVGLGAQ